AGLDGVLAADALVFAGAGLPHPIVLLVERGTAGPRAVDVKASARLRPVAAAVAVRVIDGQRIVVGAALLVAQVPAAAVAGVVGQLALGHHARLALVLLPAGRLPGRGNRAVQEGLRDRVAVLERTRTGVVDPGLQRDAPVHST